MNPQFLIAKLAANASDTAWAQAYSTLNFYVTLSISTSDPVETPLAQTGKELLEKLQREYFSLDEKTLDSIKLAVENTISSIDNTLTYSLILVTNTQDTLLIITAGEGSVTIKRGSKLGIIAQGKKDTVLSFSGPLTHQDLIVVQTKDFSNIVTAPTLAAALDSINVTDISENIAPHLHSNPSGGEAAIILLYTNPEIVVDELDSEEKDNQIKKLSEDETISEKKGDHDEENKELVSVDNTDTHEPVKNESAKSIREEKTQLPFPLIPNKNFLASLKEKRKTILGILIILLVLILIGTMIFRTQTENSANNTEAITAALASAQSDYDEGVALEPLNRPLALDKFTAAHEILTKTKNDYPEDKEIERISALLTKVEQKLSEFSSGKKVENGKSLVSRSDLSIDSIHTVSVKGGTLFVTDKSNTLVTLSSSGEINESHELESSTVIGTTAPNDEFAFVLTNENVQRINLNSGATTELFSIDKARQAIEVFGSNIYLLNTTSNMVEKYAPSSYSESDYLNSPLSKTGVDLAIDGSVFVLYDDGTVGKFTRGNSDSFAISALQGKIGKKSYIYTEEEFTNIYVLDTGNQRLLILAQNGEVKQEFTWDILKSATDFAVDEENKTVYIATPQELYSFTF